MDRGAWRAAVQRVVQSCTQLKWHSMHWSQCGSLATSVGSIAHHWESWHTGLCCGHLLLLTSSNLVSCLVFLHSAARDDRPETKGNLYPSLQSLLFQRPLNPGSLKTGNFVRTQSNHKAPEDLQILHWGLLNGYWLWGASLSHSFLLEWWKFCFNWPVWNILFWGSF